MLTLYYRNLVILLKHNIDAAVAPRFAYLYSPAFSSEHLRN